MSQAGYTPISLYYSTTAAATPSAGNLVAGELALNTVDEKLYFKNSAGTVKLLASNATSAPVLSFQTSLGGLTPSTATTGVVTLAGTLNTTSGGTGLTSFTAGDVPYYAAGSVLSKLAIGTAGQFLTSTGTAPQWSTLSGVAVTTFSAGTTGFTPSSATSGAVTLAGTLATTNGGTGLTSFTSGGVVYASSTSALTTGSALTFDGTNFSTTGSATATRFIPSGSTVATNGMYLPAANSLGFSTNSTEGMRLTSAGKLGIGLTSPASMLDVSGAANAGDPALPNQIRIQSTEAYNLTPTSGILFVNKYNTGGSIAGMGGISVYKENTTDGDYAGALGLFTRPNAGSITKVATISSSGNLGLGVTPSAWTSATGFQVQYATVEGRSSLSSFAEYGANSYSQAGTRKYIASDFASRYTQYQSIHSWHTAASGTAGNAITFTQAMTLDASGNLMVGTTSAAGVLTVVGANSSDGPTAKYIANIRNSGAQTSGVGAGIAFTQTMSSFNATLATIQGIKENATSDNYASALSFYTRANGADLTERVRIDSSGTFILKNDYQEQTFTANSSTAITLNIVTNGTDQVITLTGTATITMPTATAGKSFLLKLKTGAGGYTVTWTTVKWPSGTAPTLTSTASRMDIFSFFSDGTNWYGTTVGQNYTP